MKSRASLPTRERPDSTPPAELRVAAFTVWKNSGRDYWPDTTKELADERCVLPLPGKEVRVGRLVFPIKDSTTFGTAAEVRERGVPDGTSLAPLANAVSAIILPSTYNEPTVMWRMQRADGSSAHGLIDTVEGRARVVWFVNGRPVGARYFDDWTAAIQWSDRLRAQYWTVGWRLVSDDPAHVPPPRRES